MNAAYHICKIFPEETPHMDKEDEAYPKFAKKNMIKKLEN